MRTEKHLKLRAKRLDDSGGLLAEEQARIKVQVLKHPKAEEILIPRLRIPLQLKTSQADPRRREWAAQMAMVTASQICLEKRDQASHL